MYLSFTKISNIELDKEIKTECNYDSNRNIYKIIYKPLDLEIESKSGRECINLFKKKFLESYKKNRSLKC